MNLGVQTPFMFGNNGGDLSLRADPNTQILGYT